eukprot:330665-Rhodomonas_salina.3
MSVPDRAYRTTGEFDLRGSAAETKLEERRLGSDSAAEGASRGCKRGKGSCVRRERRGAVEGHIVGAKPREHWRQAIERLCKHAAESEQCCLDRADLGRMQNCNGEDWDEAKLLHRPSRHARWRHDSDRPSLGMTGAWECSAPSLSLEGAIEGLQKQETICGAQRLNLLSGEIKSNRPWSSCPWIHNFEISNLISQRTFSAGLCHSPPDFMTQSVLNTPNLIAQYLTDRDTGTKDATALLQTTGFPTASVPKQTDATNGYFVLGYTQWLTS